ncbi:Cyclin [Pleurostoma richardsiae]|uniref:Cyclin n=1 Tax=Pleurostoma richardsiae TaxID=41990 RepID=A0AA38VBN5_9PEZI|nr:Cyclin [Pleurostoma richardsiae]
MNCDDDLSALAAPLRNAPDCSSIATSALPDSAWFDACPQSSDTSISVPTPDSESSHHTWWAVSSQPPETIYARHPKLAHVGVPAELRRNPRRTSTGQISRSGCRPSLVRQAKRKANFVDSLVDSSAQIVEAIWPTASVVCRNETGNTGVPALRTFIQETLRRSRTSYSTLQVALYYLILIKPHVPYYDFTMEQPHDCHVSRALQCGRRMFLAALILASKYLQDRIYSARIWSRISGLNIQEINQNEMAFFFAIRWKLHITDEVYNRWTECVMKHAPSQPPSPGGPARSRFERQCEDFKNVILKLDVGLGNLEDVVSSLPTSATPPEVIWPPPGSAPASQDKSHGIGYDSADVTVKSYSVPVPMEPAPATVYTSDRLAPALGLLPTPRLTPQMADCNTPVASAASRLGRCSVMDFEMAQAGPAQVLGRWPVPMSPSSLRSSSTTHRSSLGKPVSTASAPESMVSDASQTSRSASISSASSLVSAPSACLGVQVRSPYAELCCERASLRMSIASTPVDYKNLLTSSSESYGGPGGKALCDWPLETRLTKHDFERDEAARALQELRHNYHSTAAAHRPAVRSRIGSRSSRIGEYLQHNVREMLNGRCETVWPDSLVRPRRTEHTTARRSGHTFLRACLWAVDAPRP